MHKIYYFSSTQILFNFQIYEKLLVTIFIYYERKNIYNHGFFMYVYLRESSQIPKFCLGMKWYLWPWVFRVCLSYVLMAIF